MQNPLNPLDMMWWLAQKYQEQGQEAGGAPAFDPSGILPALRAMAGSPVPAINHPTMGSRVPHQDISWAEIRPLYTMPRGPMPLQPDVVPTDMPTPPQPAVVPTPVPRPAQSAADFFQSVGSVPGGGHVGQMTKRLVSAVPAPTPAPASTSATARRAAAPVRRAMRASGGGESPDSTGLLKSLALELAKGTIDYNQFMSALEKERSTRGAANRTVQGLLEGI